MYYGKSGIGDSSECIFLMLSIVIIIYWLLFMHFCSMPIDKRWSGDICSKMLNANRRGDHGGLSSKFCIVLGKIFAVFKFPRK